MAKFGPMVFFAFLAMTLTACSFLGENAHHPCRNIIFMVPDGMGLSNTTAARIFLNGPDGERLNFETLDNIGYQSTHSANATVTDSAAAASAWAVGEKFNNGEISCHNEANDGSCANQKPTILEVAKSRGLATGLVASSQISHATPAAFGAHSMSRNCGAEIARQYIEEKDVDVIMGGGVYSTKDICSVYEESYAADDKRQYIIDKALENGYVFVDTKTAMNEAVAGGVEKVLAMFEQAGTGQGKTPELFHVDASVSYPDEEPTLAEMTAAALDILEEDEDGFFLMVEGSQIDWENHAQDVEGQLAESVGFVNAVQQVLDWVNASPLRRLNTQIIVVADHDCGGMAINGPSGRLSEAGDIIEAAWTSSDHTAVDTIVYSQGPLTWKLKRAVDNTYLHEVMEEFLKY